MKYMTYYETEEMISNTEYEKLALLLQAKTSGETETYRDFIERYRFHTTAEDVRQIEYSICRKNQKELYLEKKSLQEHLVWKDCEQITSKEAERLKAGDIAWMEQDARSLVRDFYLQMTINGLKYDYLESYDREYYRKGKGETIVFRRNLRRSRGSYRMENLSGSFVQMYVRREKTIPRVIQNMLQGMEFSNEQPSFA